MNTAKIYPIRRSEEARHEIEAGLKEYEQQRLSTVERRELTEDELRARYAKNRRPWDESWGGDCPYRISEVGSRPDQKTSLWQRIGDWYDRIWRPCFEGVGISILFLTVLMGLVFVFVNIGRATGWWGGGW